MRLGSWGSARRGSVRLVDVWHGSHGSVRKGQVRLGEAGRGQAWQSWMGLESFSQFRYGMAVLDRRGQAAHGSAGLGSLGSDGNGKLR